MKKIVLLLLFTSLANAQIINFTDTNFKAKLLSASISNSVAKDVNNFSVAIDTNNDSEIQVSEALLIYSLNVMNSAIADLSGIDSFVNLRVLNCDQNTLTSLNVTSLTELTNLDCSGNPLLALNVSGLNSLKRLSCLGTEFTTLNVSSLTNLEFLDFTNSFVSSIDVSDLTNLKTLHCGSNEITALNLSGLVNLESLFVYNNNLTSLDLTGLTNLQYLHCTFNQLSTLNVNFLSNLTSLHYGNPGLAAVDITGLNNLHELEFAQGTQLPANLESLPNLRGLGLTATFITDLDVSYLPLLTYFTANGNTVLSHVNLKNGGQFVYGDVNFANNVNLAFVCANDMDVVAVTSGIIEGSGNGAAVVNSYCSFTPGGNFNTISGTMLFDSNLNGCDTDDQSQPNIKIRINDGTNQGATFTNATGNYSFYTEEGNFTITPEVENPSFFIINPTIIPVNFPLVNNAVSNNNFCITANGNHPDAEIVIAPVAPARPGFDAIYKIVYKNRGNQLLSGNVYFYYNELLLDYVTSDLPPAQTNGLLTWAFSNLRPFEARSILVTLNVNGPTEMPAVNIGDELVFNAATDPVDGHEITFSYYQTVVGSYDPNDIQCLQGDVLPPAQIGNYLHYLIRFENTGTDYAENIVVKDIIDPAKYDLSSMQILGSSHPVNARVNGNIAEFIFQNVNLDSGGHGNVLLKLKSASTLITGDMVSNRVSIFFDYNFPVDTNNAETVFENLSVTIPNLDNSVEIYPNPANEFVNIKAAKAINSVEIYDVQGRILVTSLFNETSAKIDLSNYSSGIYYLKVKTDNGSKVEKLIKK